MKSRRVLAVEDGPTITHGGMSYGAGYVAAAAAGAVVADRPWLTGGFQGVFARYPRIGRLPAVRFARRVMPEDGPDAVLAGRIISLLR